MGLNTVAVLYNDHTSEIRDSGQVGRRMAHAMTEWNPVTLHGYFGAGRVISRDHADGYQVVVVHGNTGSILEKAKDLPPWTLEQMADCLRRHGWRAARPVRKRKALTTERRMN